MIIVSGRSRPHFGSIAFFEKQYSDGFILSLLVRW
jgi:hypothetical protein